MRKAAFTLIELLIVIAIIGTLTSIATASYLKAQSRSRDSARKSSVNAISTAVEAFYSAKAAFPGDPYTLGNKLVPTSATKSCEENTALLANENAPVYVYVPSQDCSQSNSSSNSNKFTYTPTDFTPTGTWIPGLGTYLNPFPTEPHFSNASGTADTSGTNMPTEILSSTTTNSSPNLSRTLYYRNLSTGYLAYARLENNSDRDFSTQFSDTLTVPNSVCLPTLPGVIQPPPQLSCVPTATSASDNPITLYLIRK